MLFRSTTRTGDSRVTPRTGWVAAAGALVVVSLSAALFLGVSARKTMGPGPESHESPPTGAREGVEITVEGVPKEARIRFDGTPVGARRFRVRRSELVTPLRVELEGHEPFVTSIVPRHDVTVEVHLTPLARSSASAPQPPAGKVSAKPFPVTTKPKQAGPDPGPRPDGGLGRLGRDTYYTEEFE